MWGLAQASGSSRARESLEAVKLRCAMRRVGEEQSRVGWAGLVAHGARNGIIEYLIGPGR